MQTFLPYPSIPDSLKSLDYRRLGKQRVEAKQLLRSMARDGLLKPWAIDIAALFNECSTDAEIAEALKKKNSGWKNHPARRMWEGNHLGLAYYHDCSIRVWIERGYNNTMPFVCGSEDPYLPSWFGDKDFHDSHKSNLLRKDPQHYGQFGWDVPHDLPYIWPEP